MGTTEQKRPVGTKELGDVALGLMEDSVSVHHLLTMFFLG
jgi:hypothetical protein